MINRAMFLGVSYIIIEHDVTNEEPKGHDGFNKAIHGGGLDLGFKPQQTIDFRGNATETERRHAHV